MTSLAIILYVLAGLLVALWVRPSGYDLTGAGLRDLLTVTALWPVVALILGSTLAIRGLTAVLRGRRS